MDEETVNEILGGKLKICQSRRGYRFNLDSLILAHFVSVKSRTVNLDLGCGNGIIALVLAGRYVHSKWHGLEIQRDLALLAKKNVDQNGMQRRIIIDEGDARDIRKFYRQNSFDNIVFNPPYRKIDSGRINPLPEKAIARHEISGSLDHFLQAAQHTLKPGGRVFTIYPAARMVEMISLFRKRKMEPKRMKLVFSDAFSDAEFVLTEGRSGSREEMKMEQPLFIYQASRQYTQNMKNIFTELSFPQAAAG
jgi:tRNA1Val (adenine37-N6)-methyltransferase